MIADGVHLHPVTMELILKVKEHDKIILITDAMSAARKPEGMYSLGGQEVRVTGNAARLRDGTLAGSILTLDKAIKNMVDITGISLIEAIKMATLNPAKCLGIENKKGSLEPGKDADIVILDEKLEVRATLVKGRAVYKREL
jgi:N-acetylglucosamine-6-phosphate deacetylase